MNKGLSKVVDEVIKCIEGVIDNEQNQKLVIQILKILNQHHSKLIQTTVNNELNQSMMSNASSLKSTNDNNSDKENIFKGAKVEINLVDNNAKYNKEQFSFGSSKLNQVNKFL